VSLFDKLTEHAIAADEKTATRRGFVRMLGRASVLVGAAAVGLSRARSAAARTVACCNLAYANDCSCRGCCPSGCSQWSWGCVDGSNRVWECGECYAGGSCSGCSWAYVGGLMPAR
jgi:hypothetical protein